MLTCPDCDQDFSSEALFCPGCGRPASDGTPVETATPAAANTDIKPSASDNIPEADASSAAYEKGKKTAKNKAIIIRVILLIAAVAFVVAACILFYKGHYVKNTYYYNENFPRLSKNAYVGGDAYNYIINGTYFIGYMVGGVGCMISAVITAVAPLFVKKEQ